ncbi:glycerate kinase [Campylobacter sp. RM9344]|uniref:Glycerate kinase n=1 Tax=Campylobacter californiensis TaxID=1032243 RepID=A0AAW3ZRX3_9BACT|nr:MULTISPECIES: glycerate kinase [unclassified Campylobacter]MBE2984033.1 glycerate kinase [Campylobacter sp. RM6883]MBE2987078.1 glycerate kinase [Campylobacter sp. RM12919]MBE2988354.1 glycerate kinase [Campylobacter sp. RM12920]MBE2995458.1 glycerate kinase [Campylobacter sp. RM6913]MBE3021996.1 glycerate kinase [Campylobacter sp. 7477a]MBE3030226.1 glycerate kinase [Campylobacter sp. RM9344]
MKVLVAIDSFKGSLSSLEAGLAVKEGIKDLCEVVVKPVADGGEGSVEALCDALGGRYIDIMAQNPLGIQILARYAIANDLAIMEMASTSGLTLIQKEQRDPLKTSTYGFGTMIKDAINKGARKFIIGIGGSATNDAGTGMLSALGFEFYDESGNLLKGVGEDLIKISKISTKNAMPTLKECEFLIACDVDNPLYGKNGAAYVYGPQKGADGKTVKKLDEGLINFANVVSKEFGYDFSALEGAGAAGGLGFGFVSFLSATLKSGIHIITEEIGLEEEIKKADLIITGEGKMDFQSSMGKTPTGVAKLAKKYNKPVIAFAGSVSPCAKECNSNGIDAFFGILGEPISLEEAMRKDIASQNLKLTSNQAVRLFMLAQAK